QAVGGRRDCDGRRDCLMPHGPDRALSSFSRLDEDGGHAPPLSRERRHPAMSDRERWRARADEPALEPDLPIVDAHHHLGATSPAPDFEAYDLDALIADKAGAGHNVIATVYVD